MVISMIPGEAWGSQTMGRDESGQASSARYRRPRCRSGCFALPCGWLEGDLGLFLEGATGTIRVPVPSWLVLHPQGAIVFDTGLHLDTQTDAEARLGFPREDLPDPVPTRRGVGGAPAHAGRRPRIGPLAGQLAPALRPRRRQCATPQRDARRAAPRMGGRRRPRSAREESLRPARLRSRPRPSAGRRRTRPASGTGASSACRPTATRRATSRSRVRLPGGDVVLTADACYLRRALDTLQLPPVVHDRDAMLTSFQRLRGLERAGARLYFGHDPAPWAADPQAPLEIR